MVESFHVGRRHVRDEDGDAVVIDWRAPIARAFYRATPADRMGVTLRRRFGFHDGPLTSFEDEHLDLGENLGIGSDLLRQEIERPRVGPMRDIVATIQPDQDELVRADLDTSLCIQGAPGTGKTAVGLHRAAYLLYTYPDRLRRSGVLVVGPNRAFLHYIAQVLPSLGEGGIEQTTVDQLVGGEPRADRERRTRRPSRATPRMAEVLARAVRVHVAKPVEDVVAIVGTRRYRIGAHHLRRYVDDARRAHVEGLRWSVARERLRTQVAEDVRKQREDAGGAPTDAETAKVARSQAVRDFLDEVWPALTPPALLSRLFDDADLLKRCAPMLAEEDRAALHRPRSAGRRVRPAGRAADLVLLDELSGLIDGTRRVVARGRGRGAGPVRHAVPCRRATRADRIGDRARRPGPGDDALGARRLGDDADAPRPAERVRPAAHRGLSRPGRGHRAGQPAAAAHRRRRPARHVDPHRAGRAALGAGAPS